MKNEMEEEILNPQMRTIQYGKKTLKELTIWPLSAADQTRITTFITKIVQDTVSQYQKDKGIDNVAFIAIILKNLESNIGKILIPVTDLSEKDVKLLMEELTNLQLVTLIETIWEVSFEPALKKGKDLFDRMKSLLRSERSLPSSSETSPNIDLKTSTEKAFEKEA
jgi:hypothetical protein